MSDRYNREDAKEILIGWYGNQALSWEVNDAVMDIMVEIIEDSNCSTVMNIVPRPSYNPATTAKQLLKMVRSSIFRQVKNGGKQYDVCLKEAARKRRSDIQNASFGI